MPTTKRKAPPDKGASLYMDLVRKFPLRRIRPDEELTRATEVVLALAKRDDLTEGETDYFDLLTDLIEAYEDVHHPIKESSGPDVLRFLIEQSGKSQARIAKDLDMQPSTISEILNGKRGLGRKHIEAFAPYFNVSPAVFMAKPHPSKF